MPGHAPRARRRCRRAPAARRGSASNALLVGGLDARMSPIRRGERPADAPRSPLPGGAQSSCVGLRRRPRAIVSAKRREPDVDDAAGRAAERAFSSRGSLRCATMRGGEPRSAPAALLAASSTPASRSAGLLRREVLRVAVGAADVADERDPAPPFAPRLRARADRRRRSSPAGSAVRAVAEHDVEAASPRSPGRPPPRAMRSLRSAGRSSGAAGRG